MNKFNLINWFYFDILSLSSHIMLRKMINNNKVLIMYIMTSSSLFIFNFQFAFNWQQNDYLMKKSWNTQNVACKEAPSLVFKTYIFVGKSTKMEKQLLVRYWHSSAPCRKYWKKLRLKSLWILRNIIKYYKSCNIWIWFFRLYHLLEPELWTSKSIFFQQHPNCY